MVTEKNVVTARDLAEVVAEKFELTKKEARQIVDYVLNEIIRIPLEEDKIFRATGKFTIEPKTIPARKVRVFGKEEKVIGPIKTVSFSLSKTRKIKLEAQAA